MRREGGAQHQHIARGRSSGDILLEYPRVLTSCQHGDLGVGDSPFLRCSFTHTLLIAFRSVLCSGCFVLIVGVLAMTLLPGIPVVSGLVVVSHSTQCLTHLGTSWDSIRTTIFCLEERRARIV